MEAIQLINLLKYRAKKVREISREIGVYALCDLDGIPVYVGQSVDGIQSRVRRHLTSARSDIIANRQIDVWEIAFVWAWPLEDLENIKRLESHLFHKFDAGSPLMNGAIPEHPGDLDFQIPKIQKIQVMPDEEMGSRKDPINRLPRQIDHIRRLVDQILIVKDSKQLRRSLRAHFARLDSYNKEFLAI